MAAESLTVFLTPLMTDLCNLQEDIRSVLQPKEITLWGSKAIFFLFDLFVFWMYDVLPDCSGLFCLTAVACSA